MKKGLLYIFICLLIFTGCTINTQKKTEQSITVKKSNTLNYLICVDGFDKQTNLFNTPVLNKLATNANVQLKVMVKSDNLQAYLWQLIASDSLPDLITLPAPSNISLQMTNSDYFLTVCELSKELQKYFGKANTYQTALFTNGHSNSPNEGVFVNEQYYKNRNRPNLSNLSDFSKFINDFRKNIQVTQIPIVFGKTGSDLTTLKHILGINPPEIVKSSELEEHNFIRIFNFLSLFKGGQYFNKCNLFEDVEATLNSNSCVYIGAIDTIEQFNLRNPTNKYISVMPFFEPDGFLDSQPLYNTLINRKGKTDPVFRFLEYSLSQKGRTLIDYGILDEHYYINNGNIQIMQWASEELKTNREDIVLKTGIGLFPFFTDADTPYRDQYIKVNKNRIKEIKPFTNVNPYPTSYEGNALSYVENVLFDIYSQCLYIGGSDAVKTSTASLTKLKSSPEYKAINQYYSK